MPTKTPLRKREEQAPGTAYADGVAIDLRLAFGQGLREARLKAGLTQADLETLTGIGQRYISEIEGGKHNPTLSTMVNLAMSIGQDVSTLLRTPVANKKKPAQPAR